MIPRLRELRERRMLTQRELAERAGVMQYTISRIETGRQRPTFATIRKLAVALGVRPEALAERRER